MAKLYKTIDNNKWSLTIPDRYIKSVYSSKNEMSVLYCEGHELKSVICEKIEFGFD